MIHADPKGPPLINPYKVQAMKVLEQLKLK
jgi:hypothetical protein